MGVCVCVCGRVCVCMPACMCVCVCGVQLPLDAGVYLLRCIFGIVGNALHRHDVGLTRGRLPHLCVVRIRVSAGKMK